MESVRSVLSIFRLSRKEMELMSMPIADAYLKNGSRSMILKLRSFLNPGHDNAAKRTFFMDIYLFIEETHIFIVVISHVP